MTENSSDVIYPAFVLASKLQNLDDLNEKLALFKQIALEYINTDILFAYITEPSIYDTFDISPKTEIIYISPFHKNIIFNEVVVSWYTVFLKVYIFFNSLYFNRPQFFL